MSYCTITPKYFALSDFETQLVPEGCDVLFFDLFYFLFFYLFKICLKAKVQFKVQSKVQSSPVQSSPVQFFSICYKQSSTKRSLNCTSQLEKLSWQLRKLIWSGSISEVICVLTSTVRSTVWFRNTFAIFCGISWRKQMLLYLLTNLYLFMYFLLQIQKICALKRVRGS